MPHAAARGIPLVRDPYVRPRIFHAVVLHYRFCVSHHLENDEVARVRKHERALVAEGRIELVVELAGILVHELVFDLARRKAGQFFLARKAFETSGLTRTKYRATSGGFDFKQRHIAVVLDRGDDPALIDVEERFDEFLFDLALCAWDRAARPGECNLLRAPCAKRRNPRAPARTPQCRRPCRCRGCASGCSARKCACPAPEWCRQTP